MIEEKGSARDRLRNFMGEEGIEDSKERERVCVKSEIERNLRGN